MCCGRGRCRTTALKRRLLATAIPPSGECLRPCGLCVVPFVRGSALLSAVRGTVGAVSCASAFGVIDLASARLLDTEQRKPLSFGIRRPDRVYIFVAEVRSPSTWSLSCLRCICNAARGMWRTDQHVCCASLDTLLCNGADRDGAGGVEESPRQHLICVSTRQRCRPASMRCASGVMAATLNDSYGSLDGGDATLLQLRCLPLENNRMMVTIFQSMCSFYDIAGDWPRHARTRAKASQRHTPASLATSSKPSIRANCQACLPLQKPFCKIRKST